MNCASLRPCVQLAAILIGAAANALLAGPPAAASMSCDATAIPRILDEWYKAADKGDGERYFSRFTGEAIFLGTDATERWTASDFRARFKDNFNGVHAWTYVPIERHVTISPDQSVGWFDERLRSPKYGELRGAGVLVCSRGTWKIAQYNLSFLIPNDVAASVVDMVNHIQPPANAAQPSTPVKK